MITSTRNHLKRFDIFDKACQDRLVLIYQPMQFHLPNSTISMQNVYQLYLLINSQ